MTAQLAGLMAILFAAQAVSAISGFGSTVIAVTVGAQLYSIPEILVMVLPISVLQSSLIAARNRGAIQWRLLGGEVLPLLGVGMAGGFLIAGRVGGEALRLGYGALILALALRELWVAARAAVAPAPLPRPVSAAFIGGAGVVHGIWASGGPLLVYSLGRRGLDKAAFRATLCVVWIALDSIFNARMAAAGAFTEDSLRATALLLPAALLGLWLGDRVHARIDERRFRLVTFGVLALAAIALLLR
ncbi:MAG TPA: TSUP family transporter [Kofleriaceae bacterium]|nr:TSUP family transporter [Kofleriaceae bacterium]